MKGINKYFFILLAGAALASCNKALDLKPSDQIIEEKAFLNLPSLERGIVGAYQTFNQRTTTDFGSYLYDIYSTALVSDEATLPSENNTGRGVTSYRWQIDPNTADVTNAWTPYYFGIDRANRILAAADSIAVSSSAEATTKSRIKAEAFALRAFGHLQLLINYSNSYAPNALAVPYVKVSETFGKPARQTVSQVLENIRIDLDSAKKLMPASFTTRTRMTLPAIHAIQARAALYGKNWDLAIEAATAAINAVPLASKEDYPKIWKDQTTSEVLWKMRREQANFTRAGDVFYDRSQKKIIYAPSKELRDAFDKDKDIRYSSTVVLRGANRYSVGKYIGGDASVENLADIKVFRTAEMYLIRAEAYAEKDRLLDAARDLNDLRAARVEGYVPQLFLSKQALINAIAEERFKELAFEGQRMGDLRRWLLPVTRLEDDAINAQGAVTLNPTDRQYYFPIPSQEILANENMEQNPAYLK